jgi:mRNA interferase MazF
VAVNRGDIWWADLPIPVGSEPGFRRPVVVVQSNAFNQSRIATVLSVPLTANTRLAASPGNVLLPVASTGLPRESVALTPQLTPVDRSWFLEYIGQITDEQLGLILSGIDLVLGR